MAMELRKFSKEKVIETNKIKYSLAGNAFLL